MARTIAMTMLDRLCCEDYAIAAFWLEALSPDLERLLSD
jgi:hypothetical protein